MTFNQKAQRSIQQFGKLGVNLKSLCFAPKLKHQLCWHSSFLRPRCHQFLNFCNLSNNFNIITPFTLTWIFKFMIKSFPGWWFRCSSSLSPQLPALPHAPASGEGDLTNTSRKNTRFNWKHLLNLTPLLHPLQKFRQPQNFFTMQPIWWKFLTSSRCRTLTD